MGGAGNDIYIVDNANDSVFESLNGGTDTVSTSVTYVLSENVENLTLTGSSSINGTGNSLNNTIIGNAGNNILSGGVGNDILTGGNGNDTFVIAAGQGTDTFTDFVVKNDKIGLSGGLTFGQLSFSGNNILLTSTNEVLATLTGFNTTTLITSNFLTV
ncbi:MAG: calcium-binding protein [Dolichospermum sp. DET69]|nr:MAG: calcium-binding protein [Dolichospermum sp. DET69]